MNTPTPETDAHLASQKHTYSPSVNPDFARKLERERDESLARLDEYVEKTEHIRAERDQLRKVCDAQHIRLKSHHGSYLDCVRCPDCDAFYAYNQLPHVKDKTK